MLSVVIIGSIKRTDNCVLDCVHAVNLAFKELFAPEVKDEQSKLGDYSGNLVADTFKYFVPGVNNFKMAHALFGDE